MSTPNPLDRLSPQPQGPGNPQLLPMEAQSMHGPSGMSQMHQRDPYASYMNPHQLPPQPIQTNNPRKRRLSDVAGAPNMGMPPPTPQSTYVEPDMFGTSTAGGLDPTGAPIPPSLPPPAKKSRTNTPWTPAEEQRLKAMRDQGNSWSEIAKTFPTRTEGSVKKHWYKDMHYAEFAEDESTALLAAIKDYEANKWKVIGQKLGKPAKACEQYAKEHFANKL